MMDTSELLTSWVDQYSVQWNDCLATGFASLEAMCNYFQESAWHHADHLGFGFQKLKNTDRAWVLARISMKINRYPAWRETIKVKTWPTGVERIFARRDFLFFDNNGQTLGSGASWWIIINPETRQPQIPEIVSDLILEPPLDQYTPERLRLPETLEPMGNHIVQYLETDRLGHVNNTRYAAWILNAFGPDWNNTHEIESYRIEFVNEAFTGERIGIFSAPAGDSHYNISGRRECDGKEIFRARIGLKEEER